MSELRKVCIVGFSYTTRDDAPFSDISWEFWGCNRLYTLLDAKWDRWFELHEPDTIASLGEEHIKWLMDLSKPLYMQDAYPGYPSSVRFPLEEIRARMVADWGFPEEETNYFESTIALQVALALYEGVDEISIYGVDMVKDSEYEYQKPNLEGWIMLARQQPALNGGRVKVHVPKNSALLKAATSGLYGYHEGVGVLPPRYMENVRARMKAHEKDVQTARDERDRAIARFHTQDGAKQECKLHYERFQDIERGAQG